LWGGLPQKVIENGAFSREVGLSWHQGGHESLPPSCAKKGCTHRQTSSTQQGESKEKPKRRKPIALCPAWSWGGGGEGASGKAKERGNGKGGRAPLAWFAIQGEWAGLCQKRQRGIVKKWKRDLNVKHQHVLL